MKQYVKIEFIRQYKSLILWVVINCGLSILMLSMYPAFKDSIGDMMAMLDSFPQGFLEAFGLGEGGLDMSTSYGWYGMEGYLFVSLLASSYAALIGSTILSREEDDQTIEFLLSKPLSRNQVLFGKGLIVLTNLVIMNILLFLTLFIMFTIVGDFLIKTTLLIIAGIFLLQVIFASVSFALSIFITKSRQVMSISIGLVVGLFFLDIIATLTDQLSFLKYFTPYEYVNAVSIINDQHIEPTYLLISLCIIVISMTITWYVYNRKDILL